MLEPVIDIKVNSSLYLRDPAGTELGRRILQDSLAFMDQLGIEHFTFKKLAERIHSTEASIYRYFENKHKLLTYYMNWYWTWQEYQVDYHTHNMASSREKLSKAISLFVNPAQNQAQVRHMDLDKLHHLVINESSKAYLTKEVDEENKQGFFLAYKSLCAKVAGIIGELKPDFRYPRALATTLLEAANQQRFFAQHLPRLTEVHAEEEEAGVEGYLNYLVDQLLAD